MHAFLLCIVNGLALGLFTAVLLLTSHRGQFPSRPNGLTIQLFLGFVASLIGALAVPAIFKPDFTAGVFVSLGTAQFHTMRGLERAAWKDVDKGEPVPRGAAYIEAMAAAFEARIFFILGVSAVTTVLAYLVHWIVASIAGIVLAFLVQRLIHGQRLDDMADVTVTTAVHKPDGWYINGCWVVGNDQQGVADSADSTQKEQAQNGPAPHTPNAESHGKPLPSTATLGPVKNAVDEGHRAPTTGEVAENAVNSGGSRQKDATPGGEYSLGATPPVLALMLKPDKFVGALAFNHKGQQQAILHTVAANVGVNPEGPAPAVTLYDSTSNQLLLLLSPLWPDEQAAVQAVRGAPMLEAVMPRGFPREVRLQRPSV